MFHWLKQFSIPQHFGFPSLTSNHSVSYIHNSNKVSMIYYKSQVPPCASVPHHRKLSTPGPDGGEKKKETFGGGATGGHKLSFTGALAPLPPLEPPLRCNNVTVAFYLQPVGSLPLWSHVKHGIIMLAV